MFKPKSLDHPSSPDQSDARIIKEGNKATTDENIRMNSGSSGRRKESSSSSSKQRSSRKSGESERSKVRGDRETRERNSMSSRGGDGTERQLRPSPESSRGNKGALPLQASRGSRGGGRDRDGGREGKAERGTLVPPPPPPPPTIGTGPQGTSVDPPPLINIP